MRSRVDTSTSLASTTRRATTWSLRCWRPTCVGRSCARQRWCATAAPSRKQLMDLPDDDIKMWSHMILKPARIGGELPWHQDEAYWDPARCVPRPRRVGAARPGDGAVGLHALQAGLAHRARSSNTARQRRPRGPRPRCARRSPTTARCTVELAPGGATFHHCRTLHRTPPNVSDNVRRAWANEFQIEPVPHDGDEPHRPWVRAGQAAWDNRTVFTS